MGEPSPLRAGRISNAGPDLSRRPPVSTAFPPPRRPGASGHHPRRNRRRAHPRAEPPARAGRPPRGGTPPNKDCPVTTSWHRRIPSQTREGGNPDGQRRPPPPSMPDARAQYAEPGGEHAEPDHADRDAIAGAHQAGVGQISWPIGIADCEKLAEGERHHPDHGRPSTPAPHPAPCGPRRLRLTAPAPQVPARVRSGGRRTRPEQRRSRPL
jgi:hypothetical protein